MKTVPVMIATIAFALLSPRSPNRVPGAQEHQKLQTLYAGPLRFFVTITRRSDLLID